MHWVRPTILPMGDVGICSASDVDRECSEWTFGFAGSESSVNLFQLRGHGYDSRSRLHTLRNILAGEVSTCTCHDA